MTPQEVFSQLGFNSLESEVYVALVKHGPQTAYKIGKLINKATANVYKAVEVLASEGAIEYQEGEVRVCRAIPISNLVKQLQQAYKTRTEKAVAALSQLEEERTDEGIYRLQTVESVIERAREMLARTERIAVIDAFPNVLELIADDIRRLSKEGKEIYVQAYAPVRFPKSVHLVVPAMTSQVLEYWQAEQLNIAVDGKEVLLALFNKDLSRLVQGNYSNNLYLSCMVYSGVLSEHKVHLFTKAETMEEVNKIKKNQKFFLNSKVPGLDILFEQFRK